MAEARRTCEPKCHAYGIGCACRGAVDYRHPASNRYVFGYAFGWADLMNAARRLAQQTGQRQAVKRDGATWLVTPTTEPAT